MSMIRTLSLMVLVPGGLWSAGPAYAGSITVLNQERTIDASTFIDGCMDGKFFQFDEAMDAATDNGPFDSFVPAVTKCDDVVGVAWAGQDSLLGATRIVAFLNAHTEAFPDGSHIVFGLGVSVLDVEFELDQDTAFTLSGEIDAWATGHDQAFSEVQLRLTDSAGQLVVQHFLGAGGGGQPAFEAIDDEGFLKAGVYTLHAHVGAIADVPPLQGIADAEIDVVFEIESKATCSADLDGNGDVTVTDFLALLAAWGPCPGCPADLNLDGSVGIHDLLILLAAWGPCQ